MTALRAKVASLLGVAISLSFVGASCEQTTLGMMPGVLNDTRNLSLRRSILYYGESRICDEVRQRSMPLRLREGEPIVGRFFPTSCSSRGQQNNGLDLQFYGRGYVWTTMSQRLGFEAGGYMQYDTDFQLDGSTMYVYFRPRQSAPPTFVTRMVELPSAAFFGNLPIGPGGQPLTNSFGAQIMAGQLARGFTVIREPNGNVSFGLGVVPPGSRPGEAYKNLDRSHPILANERTALYVNQRDFVGPFNVPHDKKLGLSITVEGAPAVDVLLVPRGIGEAWIDAYSRQAAATPPPAAPTIDDVVPTGPVYRRTFPVPSGSYYLVLDNTSSAGRTTPSVTDRPAVVNVAIVLE